jgi:hypothetical protein
VHRVRRRPEWAEASGRGTVHTYTVVRQYGAPPFKDELPYVVAVIELDEGVKMIGNVTGCAVDACTSACRSRPMPSRGGARRRAVLAAAAQRYREESKMNATDKLTEIEAIKRLKYRYMRGIDEKLWDQIEACFVPERPAPTATASTSSTAATRS